MFVRFAQTAAPYWGVSPKDKFFVYRVSRSGASLYIDLFGRRTVVPIGAVIPIIKENLLSDEMTPAVKKALGEAIDKEGAGPYLGKAKLLVREYVENQFHRSDPVPEFEVFVVWFSKVLQNWKALVSTTLPDQMYYEVTYNGDKNETYIDVYKKFTSVEIPD